MALLSPSLHFKSRNKLSVNSIAYLDFATRLTPNILIEILFYGNGIVNSTNVKILFKNLVHKAVKIIIKRNCIFKLDWDHFTKYQRCLFCLKPENNSYRILHY